MFPEKQDAHVVWLWRLGDDEELLLRNQQRVKTPRSDKELMDFVIVDSISVGEGELNLGKRGPKELLGDGLAERVSRHTLDADEHPECEGGRHDTRKERPARPGEHERCGALWRRSQHLLEVLRGMMHDRPGRIIDPKAETEVLTHHSRSDRRPSATNQGHQCQRQGILRSLDFLETGDDHHLDRWVVNLGKLVTVLPLELKAGVAGRTTGNLLRTHRSLQRNLVRINDQRPLVNSVGARRRTAARYRG